MPTGYSKKTGENPFKGKKRKPFSQSHKLKMSLAGKGKIPWNKGKKGLQVSCRKGKKYTEISGKKHWNWKGGKPKCKKCGKRVSTYNNINCLKCSLSLAIGDKAPNWKGGITPENFKIRSSKRYKLWREKVFRRDNFTCVWCGDNRGGNLEADHIKSFALFPKLRFEINNGRTLCHECHKKTKTYGGKSNKKK